MIVGCVFGICSSPKVFSAEAIFQPGSLKWRFRQSEGSAIFAALCVPPSPKVPEVYRTGFERRVGFLCARVGHLAGWPS